MDFVRQIVDPNRTMKNAYRLLLVDDDSLIADTLRLMLPKNWDLQVVRDSRLVPTEGRYHAAFVDLHLTGNLDVAEGPEVIQALRETFPRIELVAISGDLNLELMEKCLDCGAKKFLAKPLLAEEVKLTLEKIEALWKLREIEWRPQYDQAQWIGRSQVSESLKAQIAQLRGEKGPILIEGETGTGKEVVSRLLQQQDPGRPFVPVHISAIAENLFESELFGHVKGAFTGADQIKIGLIEASAGGDLFLDEIEALPLHQQVKLLRFLESGEIRKVGAKDPQRIQTRVIVASNEDLESMVKQGRFREDLYFRLNARRLRLPPLRQRSEDVEDLVRFFLMAEKPRSNKVFTPEAILHLSRYPWPGNVRELRRIVEQVSLTSPLPMIRPQDVDRWLRPQEKDPSEAETFAPQSLEDQLSQFESQVIQKTLSLTQNVEQTMTLLQISRSSLYKKIKDYNLEVPS